MVMAGRLTASLEDYLEAIFQLIVEKQVARARDIAKRLNVKRSSVTGALRSLADKGFVDYEPYEIVTLTPKGKAAARDVVRRHEVLRDFLIKVLSVNEDKADEAACRMEHAITPSILERLIEFVEFVEVCPRGGTHWIEGFARHCEQDGLEDCERCASSCLQDVRKKIKHREQHENGNHS